MGTFLRCIGATIAGIVLAISLVIAVELWSNMVYPLPPGSKGTMEEICAHVERYPQWILAIAALTNARFPGPPAAVS